MTPEKAKQYVAAIQEFSKGWWNEILKLSDYDPKLIPEVAKQAAINYVEGKNDWLRPTILMANEAINILEEKAKQNSSNINRGPIEAVKQLRDWFESLGISPGNVVIIGDFVDIISRDGFFSKKFKN